MTPGVTYPVGLLLLAQCLAATLASCSASPPLVLDGGDSETETDTDTNTDPFPPMVPCAGGLYDPVSDLCWQDPPAADEMGQPETVEYCLNLVSGGSSDWMLPDIDQLRSLVRGCPGVESGGDCPISSDSPLAHSYHDACSGCPAGGGPGSLGRYWDPQLVGDPLYVFWSSSMLGDLDDMAWAMEFGCADPFHHWNINALGRARCVRPGM